MRPVAVVLAIALAAPPLGAQHVHEGSGGAAPKLGTIVFPNSGSAGAQPAFLEGVALLHSFHYDDAVAAFGRAQRADSSFALAYWLEALAHHRGLWAIDDSAGGRRVLAKLGATPEARLARATTPRERGFGEAVEALFAPGVERARVEAYAAAFRRLVAAHPDDPEAATFAAVALMNLHRYQSAVEYEKTRQEAAGLARRVFARNADHPGAAHYIIHALDAPHVAAQALDAARAYAKVAPDAEHALHMPSHIFVQLGMWDDVVASNERAVAASHDAMRARGWKTTAIDYHSVHWLVYGYVQQGRWREARVLVDSVRRLLAPHVATGAGRFPIALIETAWSLNTDRWASAAWERPPAPTAASTQRARLEDGQVSYWQAIGALRRGGADSVAPAFALAQVRRARLAELAPDAPQRPSAIMMATQLEALVARARGDTARALVLIDSSAAAADAVPQYGPPQTLLSQELLGEWLLAAGRPADAMTAYTRALRATPKRSSALLGLARAHAGAGHKDAAAKTYAELLHNYRRADADLPWLAEARRGAGSSVATTSPEE